MTTKNQSQEQERKIGLAIPDSAKLSPDTLRGIFDKEIWGLKYADGSSAEHLFKSHNKSVQRIKVEVGISFRNILDYMRAYCSMATNEEAWENFQDVFYQEKKRLGLKW